MKLGLNDQVIHEPDKPATRANFTSHAHMDVHGCS